MHKLVSGSHLNKPKSFAKCLAESLYKLINKVFKSRLSVLLLGSCCVHSSWLPEIDFSLRPKLSFASW